MSESISMLQRYKASMVLSGVGDALGFRNGRWEFCFSGPEIHKELEGLGGIENITVIKPKWRVSDDTVMHLAVAEALVNNGDKQDRHELYVGLAYKYKESMQDMQGRSAGLTCRGNAYALQPHEPKGCYLPFDERGGGCGAAMRSMCIGLRYPRPEDIDSLIAVGVESGRMTHHHPTGYLGSVASALFVSYAIQGKPLQEWGAGLMELLPKVLQYVQAEGRYVEENKSAWSYFEDHWRDYLKLRGISDGLSEPTLKDVDTPEQRDKFYKSVSFNGWGGASGHDAPLIAYDALLGAGSSWSELCSRGMFHGGDNDSTGVIAGACYGAMYGFNGVPVNNYKNLEYKDRLTGLAVDIFKLSHPDESIPSEDEATSCCSTTTCI